MVTGFFMVFYVGFMVAMVTLLARHGWHISFYKLCIYIQNKVFEYLQNKFRPLIFLPDSSPTCWLLFLVFVANLHKQKISEKKITDNFLLKIKPGTSLKHRS